MTLAQQLTISAIVFLMVWATVNFIISNKEH